MKKNNVIVNQYNSKLSSFQEINLIDALISNIDEGNQIHISVDDGNIRIDSSVDTRVIVDNRVKDTNIFYIDDRVGIGRGPLHTYKFDIKVPENTLMTAFHVGDGKYGFSMGNGTSKGFLPEIIGMGSDENDAGLYFLGRAGNNVSSSVPLIVIDGRNHKDKTLTNRPIFGITSAQYNEYELLIDQYSNLNVKGSIRAIDFILDSSVSVSDLMMLIIEQKDEIDILKNKVHKLEIKNN